MNTNITNTNVELTVEGRGLISKYNPNLNETLTIAHSFSFNALASVEECMQTVASLCGDEGIPVIKDSNEATAYLANMAMLIDEEWQQGLISMEDADKDICILMWLIASLTNAKWFEVFFDQGNVLFWSLTAEELSQREQQMARNSEKLAA